MLLVPITQTECPKVRQGSRDTIANAKRMELHIPNGWKTRVLTKTHPNKNDAVSVRDADSILSRLEQQSHRRHVNFRRHVHRMVPIVRLTTRSLFELVGV